MEERKRLRSHGPPGARVGLSGCSSERHQSGCAADAVEEKCTIRPVLGGFAASSMRRAKLSLILCCARAHSGKKKALLALALLVFGGARLIPVKCFVVTLLGLRGAGPLVRQVPRRRGCLGGCCGDALSTACSSSGCLPSAAFQLQLTLSTLLYPSSSKRPALEASAKLLCLRHGSQFPASGALCCGRAVATGRYKPSYDAAEGQTRASAR